MINGVAAYETGLSVLAGSYASQASGVSRTESDEGPIPFGLTGDSVEISDEAYELLRSKMEEFQGMAPGDLTEEQKEELKGALSKALGISEEEVETLARNMAAGPPPPPSADESGFMGQAGAEGEAQGGQGESGKGVAMTMGAAGGQSAQGGQGGSAQTTSSTVDDQIDKLEQEIEELQEEIQKLQAKAGTDEDAKDELKTKQVELSTKQSELAELESQQEDDAA